MNKSVKIVLGVFGTIILLMVGAFFYLKIQLVPRNYSENTVFTIEKGTYGRQVFTNLEEEGIIRNAKIDYAYIKYISGIAIDFKAGSFELTPGMSLEEIVKYLCDDSKFYRPTTTITVTEGSFLIDIAQQLADNLKVEKDKLLEYWDDEKVIRSYMSDYPFLTEEIFNENIRYKLEGYLFPNTYEFYIDSSMDEITTKFLDQTLSIFKKYADDFANTPVFYHDDTKKDEQASIHEIFTMASILEWESGNDSQMQDISSVFYNRLNQFHKDGVGDNLRSSVTSCYSLGYDKGSCLLVDRDLNLAYETAGYTEWTLQYNTYVKRGLPVGPISAPGETAIYSALHPNDTDYYYFVGDICGIDGLTHFATIEEGNEAISNKYVSCRGK